MIVPGPLNAITDIAGITVGNAEDRQVWTGVTVLLCERPLVAAVDVRGGAPGARDTDLLAPDKLVEGVDALVLAGGSEFGLDAAGEVVTRLSARGRGLAIGARPVPIVPAAILFDLANGGDKDWGLDPPYRRLAAAALDNVGATFALGNAGAGYGAKAADYKGGLGSASARDGETGITVGALIAANPVGTPVMPGSDSLWAWPFEQAGELGGQPAPSQPVPPDAGLALDSSLARPQANTVIGVVATDADLSKAEAQRLAVMAQDGYARAVRPSHTVFDGDLLFALASGARSLPEPRARALARLGAIAADVVTRAFARGIYEAETLGRYVAYRERHGHALGRR
ncbi:MAG: P1 family peptidase [Azospirillaceae bacterium]